MGTSVADLIIRETISSTHLDVAPFTPCHADSPQDGLIFRWRRVDDGSCPNLRWINEGKAFDFKSATSLRVEMSLSLGEHRFEQMMCIYPIIAECTKTVVPRDCLLIYRRHAS